MYYVGSSAGRKFNFSKFQKVHLFSHQVLRAGENQLFSKKMFQLTRSLHIILAFYDIEVGRSRQEPSILTID